MGLWPQVGTGVCKRLRTDAGVAVAGHDSQGAREMGCGRLRKIQLLGILGRREMGVWEWQGGTGRQCDQAEAMGAQEGRDAM